MAEGSYQPGLSNAAFKAPHKTRIGAAIYVLAWIADHATAAEDTDEGTLGWVFRGRVVQASDIAADVGDGVRTVERHLSQLKAAGYIVKDRRKRGVRLAIRTTVSNALGEAEPILLKGLRRSAIIGGSQSNGDPPNVADQRSQERPDVAHHDGPSDPPIVADHAGSEPPHLSTRPATSGSSQALRSARCGGSLTDVQESFDCTQRQSLSQGLGGGTEGDGQSDGPACGERDDPSSLTQRGTGKSDPTHQQARQLAKTVGELLEIPAATAGELLSIQDVLRQFPSVASEDLEAAAHAAAPNVVSARRPWAYLCEVLRDRLAEVATEIDGPQRAGSTQPAQPAPAPPPPAQPSPPPAEAPDPDHEALRGASTHAELWEAVCARIKAKIQPVSFDQWIAPLFILDVRESPQSRTVIFKAPTQEQAEWADEHYGWLLTSVLSEGQSKSAEVEIIRDTHDGKVVTTG